MSNFNPGRGIIIAIIIVMLFAALVGCSAGSDDYGSTHSYTEDQYDPVTGVTLKAYRADNYSFLSFEQMVSEYVDLEQCMVSNTTPGPTIIFESFNHIGTGGTAFYVYVSQTAYINTDSILAQRNHISDREFLRHEYGHHVLYLNGLDETHNNPLFEECSALGPRTCNGEYCE